MAAQDPDHLVGDRTGPVEDVAGAVPERNFARDHPRLLDPR